MQQSIVSAIGPTSVDVGVDVRLLPEIHRDKLGQGLGAKEWKKAYGIFGLEHKVTPSCKNLATHVRVGNVQADFFW